jgi:hypothetical protein
MHTNESRESFILKYLLDFFPDMVRMHGFV